MRKTTLASCLILAGCTVGPSLATRMTAFIGARPEVLVQNLGVPDKQISVGGVDYLAYEQHHTEIIPGFGPYDGFSPFGAGLFYGGPDFGGIPPQAVDLSCEITFMLKDDRVFNVVLRGNDC